MKKPHRCLLPALALALTACGEPAQDAEEAPAPAPAVDMSDARVMIMEPAEGAVLMGDAVTVRLAVSGVAIVPAGDTVAGTGHHHLYLDADLTDPTAPVPTVPGSIIHMGDGSAEYTFEGVAPGEHRIIAVVADGIHMPLQPWVVDTVTFTVN